VPQSVQQLNPEITLSLHAIARRNILYVYIYIYTQSVLRRRRTCLLSVSPDAFAKVDSQVHSDEYK